MIVEMLRQMETSFGQRIDTLESNMNVRFDSIEANMAQLRKGNQFGGGIRFKHTARKSTNPTPDEHALDSQQ